jgi:hypothetical protein
MRALARSRWRRSDAIHDLRARYREATMSLNVQIEPAAGTPPHLEYRWDADTDILTASLASDATEGPAGIVEVQGRDGSWVILDLRGGRIRGVEVAVWPDVRKLPTLLPPAGEYGRAVLARAATAPGVVEFDTAVSAEMDAPERTFHFRFGGQGSTRSVRIADGLLLDVEPSSGKVVGLWLLDVPPFPLDQ